jgi:glycosyltransferase involved in cell wall biosynthesis
MANILYLSCHSVLEHDEVKLLTELGHNVFSMGSYINPKSPHDNKRPGFEGYYNDHLQSVAIQCSKENLHQELIDWAQIIIVMHRVDWVLSNWEKMQGKRVIWRAIGQSEPGIENQLIIPKMNGLKLVRYSPGERTITNYAGEDALIRFYKDKEEFNNWNGDIAEVMTVGQSMQQRGDFCHFNFFDQATKDLPRKLFGPENENSGIEGGVLTYEELKKAYRDYRVFFYTGTYPASYTLGFMEALMTGIPVVALGNELWDTKFFKMDVYEVDKIIQNGINGYVSNNLNDLREAVELLLEDKELARKIGQAGRETAIKLYDKDVIRSQWQDFL